MLSTELPSVAAEAEASVDEFGLALPGHSLEPYDYPFSLGDVAWSYHPSQRWHKVLLVSEANLRMYSTSPEVAEYPIHFYRVAWAIDLFRGGAIGYGWAAPALGELKPDTPYIRELLAEEDAEYVDDVLVA